jgi:hypothetical protein
MKNVVIFEDNMGTINKIIAELALALDNVDIVYAVDLKAANSIVEKVILGEIKPDLIACDACLNLDSRVDTATLVTKMRSVFTGAILAISSNDSFNDQLIKAGASHKCHKDNAGTAIINLLGENIEVPTILSYNGMTLDFARREYILSLLHACLVNSDQMEKDINMLSEVVAMERNENAIKVVADVKAKISNLAKIEAGSEEHTTKLRQIRDDLITLYN